ncbi:hypothetical protein HYH03_008167 [Edaphochlamys debaryana]|uniref:Putative gamma-glutamylcyclotransferase n=1 Tax=Edaphochlamys debaryana TaxID=47281 RepID=A0A835Y0J2_9CHLO|nr:hypothetical protein HYH03_008167 [Edaphochlamys debaryana]|eukprot:KAG2493651.1 hypothetical protein HYH03_008167 [Edaphochlamys debaryana]
MELSDKELHILDVYESEEYYRASVKPVLEDGSEVEADVYVWKEEFRPMLEEAPWSYAEFLTQHSTAYFAMTVQFAEQCLKDELLQNA